MRSLARRSWISTMVRLVLSHSALGSTTLQRGMPIGFMAATKSQLNVLVVLAGPSDRTTALVFHDIAHTVSNGLHSLGYPSRTVFCANLVIDHCFVEGEQLVVLAPHNLASYTTVDGRSAVLENELLPPDAVLYNFEHVPSEWPTESGVEQSVPRDRSLISARMLEIYSMFRLWDYSERNVEHLLHFGIHAELLPLGYSPELGSKHPSSGTTPGVERDDEDIDVLFVGMETPKRKTTIQRLRDAGLSVVHPNSAGIDLYGAGFDAMFAKSKIALNLNAFDSTSATEECSGGSGSVSNTIDHETNASDSTCSNGEWKMPRLARLLASGRFVVSEMGGTASERAQLSDGVIFVPAEQLADTCKYYLQHPELRRSIAERGRDLFQQRLEADILRGPVEDMLLGRKKTSRDA